MACLIKDGGVSTFVCHTFFPSPPHTRHYLLKKCKFIFRHGVTSCTILLSISFPITRGERGKRKKKIVRAEGK